MVKDDFGVSPLAFREEYCLKTIQLCQSTWTKIVKLDPHIISMEKYSSNSLSMVGLLVLFRGSAK